MFQAIRKMFQLSTVVAPVKKAKPDLSALGAPGAKVIPPEPKVEPTKTAVLPVTKVSYANESEAEWNALQRN